MKSYPALAEEIRRLDFLPARPPVLPAEIEAFEALAGVQLPGDYREFLLQVCNGISVRGSILGLDFWACGYWIEKPKPFMAGLECILHPDMMEDDERWLDKAAGSDWEERMERGVWDPMFGTITLKEVGCGIHDFMVLTGPHRGRIFSWGDHILDPPRFHSLISYSEWVNFELNAILHPWEAA